MDIASQVREIVRALTQDMNASGAEPKDFSVIETKPEFEGDFTLVLFPFVKKLKKSPEVLGAEWGQKLLDEAPSVFTKFNVIKGFLNLTVSDQLWIRFLEEKYGYEQFGW